MLNTLAVLVAVTLAPNGVHDGDSVRLSTGERIRLAGIDAPEMRGSPACIGVKARYHNCDHVAAERSRAQLMVLVAGRKLTLERLGIDKYGRTLGYLYADGVSVNCQMLVKHAAEPRYSDISCD